MASLYITAVYSLGADNTTNIDEPLLETPWIDSDNAQTGLILIKTHGSESRGQEEAGRT